MKTIKIFDTTLRDGEQSPGCSMNLKEKIKIAHQLEKLGVDVIEAGFAACSRGDFEGVRSVADTIKNCTVASLARALPADIDAAWEAIRQAADPRIHIFLATSPLHMEYKLKKTRDEVLAQAAEAVRYAKKYTANIEFSAEDASRSDPDFLCEVFRAVISAGAVVVNVPDTVGYCTPEDFCRLISYIRVHTPIPDHVGISVHCHNDLGMAVANSLAAISAGVSQIECTVNGIGERAGNASLEEIVMNLHVRRDYYNAETRVDTTQIYRTSRMLASTTGVRVQPNKAIIGENAFAHESGIHQHGILANRATYEIMTPESIGLSENKMILGKHSGRHAFTERIAALGIRANEDEINELFVKFKALADKKKTVGDRDIEALARETVMKVHETYVLEKYIINSGNIITSTSNIVLQKHNGGIERFEEVAAGDGPIAASFNAVNKITGLDITLQEYDLSAVTGGGDAQGEVSVKIICGGKKIKGYGVSTDIIEASIKAYLDAINNYIYEV